MREDSSIFSHNFNSIDIKNIARKKVNYINRSPNIKGGKIRC